MTRFLDATMLQLDTDRPVWQSAARLRGFFGAYKDYPLLHQHLGEEGVLYAYPLVQYKVIGGTPVVLGFEEGGEQVRRVSEELSELVLDGERYQITGYKVTRRWVEFGPLRSGIDYRFVSPWVALNQGNFSKFKDLRGSRSREGLLRRILVGNVLSMSKSLNYFVRRRLRCSCNFEETRILFKGLNYVGFTGEFKLNFLLPNFIGLGKGVSHGFGTVIKTSN